MWVNLLALVAVAELFFSVLDIVKGALILSIPLFLLAILGSFFHGLISKRFKASWLASAVITLFVFSAVFSFIAYTVPLILAFQAQNIGVVPPELRLGFGDIAQFFLFYALKVVLSAALMTAFAIPFVFLGGFFHDWLKKKKFNEYICLFLAVFASCLVASVLLLFFFGWVFQGLIFLLYFSG